MTPTGARRRDELHTGEAIFAALVGTLLLSAYGDRVCNYLGSLGLGTAGSYLLVAFAGALALRTPILRALVGAVGRRPGVFFAVDLGLWVAVGLGVSLVNASLHGFPADSGVKLTLGAMVLGLFAAAGSALNVQRDLILSASAHTEEQGASGSLPTRLFSFAAVAMVLVAGVLTALLWKEVEHASSAMPEDHAPSIVATAREVVFVLAVLVAATGLVGQRLRGNLRLLFRRQLDALGAVAEGNLGVGVPVATRDELGTIAVHTNRMIESLAEKARLEQAFGRFTSPAVVEAILASGEAGTLAGREVDVAVLFTDLRGFTPLTESLAPAEVVALLNTHFEHVVERVREHGGVVDKFLGDGAMAVFGLDGAPDACDAAVRCALALQAGLEALNARLQDAGLPPVACGVGVDAGRVIAGTIGSPERMEYTVIGDPVNTASRLEALTVELGSSIAVSERVVEKLEPSVAARLTPRGQHFLKGKSAPQTVYSA